jgi:hypothetical protein
VDNNELILHPDGDANVGTCPDCGNATRSVWGRISQSGAGRAMYFIRWTDGHPERGALIVVSIGRWGENAKPSDRVCMAFECRMGSDRPGFMVIDASAVPWAQRELLGQKLSREDALKNPVLQQVFGILDYLAEHDARFREFLLSGRRTTTGGTN